MKKHIVFAALSALAFVAHADVVDELKKWFIAYNEKNHVAETVVFSPAYKMTIGGKAVPVFGNQACPLADGMRVWFYGGDPHGGSGCIVIEKDTASVQTRFILDGKDVAEVWTVEHREPDKTLLRRPNGDYLSRLTRGKMTK